MNSTITDMVMELARREIGALNEAEDEGDRYCTY